MNGIVLMVLGLVVPGCSGEDDRDKSGTTGCAFGTEVRKSRENKPCREADRETAERAGHYFGPSKKFGKTSDFASKSPVGPGFGRSPS